MEVEVILDDLVLIRSKDGKRRQLMEKLGKLPFIIESHYYYDAVWLFAKDRLRESELDVIRAVVKEIDDAF